MVRHYVRLPAGAAIRLLQNRAARTSHVMYSGGCPASARTVAVGVRVGRPSRRRRQRWCCSSAAMEYNAQVFAAFLNTIYPSSRFPTTQHHVPIFPFLFFFFPSSPLSPSPFLLSHLSLQAAKHKASIWPLLLTLFITYRQCCISSVRVCDQVCWRAAITRRNTKRNNTKRGRKGVAAIKCLRGKEQKASMRRGPGMGWAPACACCVRLLAEGAAGAVWRGRG